MRMYSRLLLTATAAAGLAAFSAAPAHATLEITLHETGFADVTMSAASSPLVLNQSPFGNFDVTVNTGTTTGVPSIDISSDDTTVAGGTLVVTFSEDGLTSPTGINNWLTQFTGNFTGGGGTASVSSFLGATLNSETTALSTVTPGNSAVATASTTAPFAITEVLTLVAQPNSGASLDASVERVPEPATIGLLGSALFGLGLLARRNRKA